MTESIFGSLVLMIYSKCIFFIQQSAFYRLMDNLWNKFIQDVSNSKIIGILNENEKSSFYFKYSRFFIQIQTALNNFVAFIRDIYDKIKNISEASKVFRIICWMSARIIGIIGIYILFQMIIPEEKWHNIYNFLFIGVIAIIHLIKMSIDVRYNLIISKIDVSVMLFIGALILSVINSEFSGESIKNFIIYAFIFILFFIMINVIRNKKGIMLLIYFIVATATVVSLYGIYQKLDGIPVDPLLIDLGMGQALPRVYSTFGNPNIYAGFLILTLPFYGTVFCEQKQLKVKILISVLVLLNICNIALTYSRASYIALGIAVVTFLFLKNKKVFPILVLLVILIIPVIPKSIITRLFTLGKDTSSLYRFKIWKASIDIIKDNWVLGIGIGSERFTRFFVNYSEVTPPAHTHMFFLQIWLEYGILGFMSIMWMLIRLTKWGLKVLRESNTSKMKNIIIGCISALAGITVFGLAENISFYSRLLNMFWIIVAIFMITLNISGLQYKKLEMDVLE